MKRDVPFAPTFVGLRDVGDAREMIAGMRQSSAKTHLEQTLGDIEEMMYARISQCTSLVIHPEEAEAGELELARLDLGPLRLDEAERRRSVMLAARTRGAGVVQRFYRQQPSIFSLPDGGDGNSGDRGCGPEVEPSSQDDLPPSYDALARGTDGFLPTYGEAKRLREGVGLPEGGFGPSGFRK